MKIQTLIKSDHVYLSLQASDRAEALKIVSELTAPAVKLSAEVVEQGLLEREALGSTAIGGGFAIPHCKLRGLNEIAVTLARFRTPVTFGSPEGEGVRFLFVVLSPPDQPALHLQVLSQIARTLKDDVIRHRLLEVEDPVELIEIVKRAADGENL
ncbi:MAG: hypothetical protein DRJ65_19350 [Acidobacteria bacterium]|nr:MAG: hypothetical protein DRJ65_19350 [Acidobacteriota bacterium]